MRTKKALLNSITSLVLEIVTVLSGLILPRFIITAFGSEFNGITSSVSHFLSAITLLRSGVGGVARASLYKPLAQNDIDAVSGIVKATEFFLRKVALIFAAGLLIFASVYPFVVIEEFDWLYAFALVLILGFGSFIQYYFGLTYQLLLMADQKMYLYSAVRIVLTFLNLFGSILLIRFNCSFMAIKLFSSLSFAISPIFLLLYVRRKYALNTKVQPDMHAIKQRWDAFGQQIANYITENSDVMLLTIFTNMRYVSVYSIHVMVTAGVKALITNFTSGLDSAFGNMIAKGEEDALKRNFRIYELLNHSLSTLFFACAFVLLTPFVSIYTQGVSDIDYFRPTFCVVIVLAEYSYCLRAPYKAVTYAAGHYKQTRKSAFIEATINVIVSVLLVRLWGLVGVAIGTLASVVYRTISFVGYLSKNILNRKIFVSIRNMVISSITFAVIAIVGFLFIPQQMDSYATWIMYAIPITLFASISVVAAIVLFSKQDAANMVAALKRGVLKAK